MGKAYANRKKEIDRPDSDYYGTPIPLIWELIKLDIFNKDHLIYEPASGEGVIGKTLTLNGFRVTEDDIRTTGKNFLECEKHYPVIITNPPFSLFDEFVVSAKRCSDRFAFIAKTNFFGAYKRYENGIWNNLKSVYIFNRQIDYRYNPFETKLKCGNLITGWFIWDLSWNKDYWETKIIDVQKYCK